MRFVLGGGAICIGSWHPSGCGNLWFTVVLRLRCGVWWSCDFVAACGGLAISLRRVALV